MLPRNASVQTLFDAIGRHLATERTERGKRGGDRGSDLVLWAHGQLLPATSSGARHESLPHNTVLVSCFRKQSPHRYVAEANGTRVWMHLAYCRQIPNATGGATAVWTYNSFSVPVRESMFEFRAQLAYMTDIPLERQHIVGDTAFPWHRRTPLWHTIAHPHEFRLWVSCVHDMDLAPSRFVWRHPEQPRPGSRLLRSQLESQRACDLWRYDGSAFVSDLIDCLARRRSLPSAAVRVTYNGRVMLPTLRFDDYIAVWDLANLPFEFEVRIEMFAYTSTPQFRPLIARLGGETTWHIILLYAFGDTARNDTIGITHDLHLTSPQHIVRDSAPHQPHIEIF